MAILGVFAYREAGDALREHTTDHLQAVAVSQLDAFERVATAWKESAQLIANRTQLRLSLRDFARNHDEDELARIRRILFDATRDIQSIRSITVYDIDGHGVAYEGPTRRAQDRLGDLDPSRRPEQGTIRHEVPRLENGGLRKTFVLPMDYEDVPVGWAEVVIRADDLIDLTDDYSGLGETGEKLVVSLTEDGDILVLNGTRFEEAPPMTLRLPADDDGRPVVVALRSDEPQILENAIDYRGVPVVAATRHLDDFDWGLVVKFDIAELEHPIVQLRESLLRTGLALSAFAVVLGTLLGVWFSRPIRELALVADQIRRGSFVRADASANDEIGLLAETFNRMTDELVSSNQELRRRIQTGEHDLGWMRNRETKDASEIAEASEETDPSRGEPAI